MTALAAAPRAAAVFRVPGIWDKVRASRRVVGGGAVIAAIVLLCLVTLPLTLNRTSDFYYDGQNPGEIRHRPTAAESRLWLGADELGRSVLGRCLLGGAISLAIGAAAAAIAVVLGTAVGLLAGYRGGWVDALLMRSVDVLYGLPYIVLVILLRIGCQDRLAKALNSGPAANLIVLFCGIGLVSWLTMVRVVRGQVLTLKTQPFIEAARAGGLTRWRIFAFHLLPNLVGPIIVYTTLVVPQAILQESFLSFLGVGIMDPMPTWGSLASDGLLPALNPIVSRWWMLVFPCTLLAVTLLSLNFLGDGLRDVLDPRREAAKI